MPASTTGREQLTHQQIMEQQQKKRDVSQWSAAKCRKTAKEMNFLPNNATNDIRGAGSLKKWRQHILSWCEEQYKTFENDNQPFAEIENENSGLDISTYRLIVSKPNKYL
jgi:hypothetical protein